jgi:hypothetical protein
MTKGIGRIHLCIAEAVVGGGANAKDQGAHHTSSTAGVERGRAMITPLLSCGKRLTGFWTWEASGTAIGVHGALGLGQPK